MTSRGRFARLVVGASLLLTMFVGAGGTAGSVTARNGGDPFVDVSRAEVDQARTAPGSTVILQPERSRSLLLNRDAMAAVPAPASVAASAPALEPTDGTVAPGPGERPVDPIQPDSAGRFAPLVAGVSNAPAPSTGVSFLSTSLGADSTFIPPDTTGAVGPSNVVIPLNGRIKVFSKTGTQQYSATLDDFFSSVNPGGPAFDPRVEYDAISGRWFVIAINGGSNNTIMVATSNGSDVSNGEVDFSFKAFVNSVVLPVDVGRFADYPTLAVDANSVLIGTNNFSVGDPTNSLFVIDKSDLIGGTLTVKGFSVPEMWTPQPVENDAVSETSYIVGVDYSTLGVLNFRRVTYPGGVPTLSSPIPVTVPAVSDSRGDVPAKGSTIPLDALDERLYEARISLDPTTGEPRLWTAHNMQVTAGGVATGATGRIGSRWYEFGTLDATPTLLQSGTLYDSTATNPDSYWIPSIAANGQGHAVIGSSVAGPNRFAGVALAQRFHGDAAGSLGPVNFAQPGAGSYTLDYFTGRNRWGDYSQVSIDPTDNMTFWTFQEYVAAVDVWGVRVIEVKAPPPATPTVASTVPSGRASVSVDITGTSSNGSGFYDPGSAFPKRLVVDIAGGVVVNSVTYNRPTSLTLDVDTTGATVGVHDVSVTNPDGQVATGTGILTVVSVPAAPSGVSGVAGSRQVAVSWVAPASNGGSPITGYTVTAAPGGGTCVTAGATSCTVTGLTNGTAYTFTVTATNAVGTGPPSAASASVTPVSVPPVAAPDSAVTAKGTAVFVDVLANDTDVDGDTLTIVSWTKGDNGSVRLVDGLLRYGPKSGFRGTDTFSYTISDGNGGTATATVTVTVTQK